MTTLQKFAFVGALQSVLGTARNSHYIPPADYIRIPTDHPMQVAAWRMPNGAKHVELRDDTEATWVAYCKSVKAAALFATKGGK